MAYSNDQVDYLKSLFAQGYRGESITNALKNMATDQGDVLAAQQQHFKDTYVPVEKELMSRISDPSAANVAGSQAGELAQKAGQITRADFMRDWERRGANMSSEVGSALSRSADLNDALDITNAENSARSATFTNNLNVMANAIGTGRGVASGALEQASSSSKLASSRNSANAAAEAQAKAQDQAAKQQQISTGVGIAVSVAAIAL